MVEWRSGPGVRACVLIGLFFTGVMARESTRDLVVDTVDYTSYAGTWYEIARLPNKHERGLVEVTSTFKLAKDGTMKLVNRGYKGSRGGTCKTVKGDVVVPDKRKAGALKVKVWLFSIDYRIIELDHDNYQYAMVTTDSRDNLWILSRTPSMDASVYTQLVQSARDKGFEVDRLYRVPQVSNSAVVGR
jgi:apolipoprotein D and lipocalin family protein